MTINCVPILACQWKYNSSINANIALLRSIFHNVDSVHIQGHLNFLDPSQRFVELVHSFMSSWGLTECCKMISFKNLQEHHLSNTVHLSRRCVFLRYLQVDLFSCSINRGNWNSLIIRIVLLYTLNTIAVIDTISIIMGLWISQLSFRNFAVYERLDYFLSAVSLSWNIHAHARLNNQELGGRCGRCCLRTSGCRK